MNIRSLASHLVYQGEVEAKRQTYHVFEAGRHYFVMSLSRTKRHAGNFNIVSREAAEAVARRFADRQGVTSSDVAKASRRRRRPAGTLEALNVLYVLVATGRAKIDARFRGRQLRFNVTG